MSLIKQLWLAIAFILALASGGSFILSTLSSKNTLEQQLQMKNIDNATSLALSMSQLPKDPTTLELLLSAQFDSGHYRYIGLFDPSGKRMSERINSNSHTKAPRWFVKLIPMHVQAGVAEIQKGWTQYGSLKLESDQNFAYDQLWDATLLTALWVLLIGVLCGYAGRHLLRKILSPLKEVVNQAQAIGEQRFITITEPKTFEFKALVSAMNKLSGRIKTIANEESARLDQLRFQTNFDATTGLMNYDYFVNKVDASISHEEYFNEGALIVTRLSNLASIDQAQGYHETNALLGRIGQALVEECTAHPTLFAGRVSGTDFAVFSTQTIDAYTLGGRIKNLLEKVSLGVQPQLNGQFLTVTSHVTTADVAEDLMTLSDSVLDEISTQNNDALHHINQNDTDKHHHHEQHEWQMLLTTALDYKRIKLEHYPVVNYNGALIHNESPVRLQLTADGKWFCAGEFITWATQLNLMSRVDELVIETAIDLLNKGAQPIGLNVSTDAICNPAFITKITQSIQQNISVANRLYFEVPEQSAFDHLTEFRSFSSQLKALGCKIGIEHVGSRLARLGELHDIGLDYIKIDASTIRGIDSNEANKTLLRGICMIAHSIGVLTIAEGVQTEIELSILKQIGVDGMTGPGVKISLDLN